MTKYDEKMCRIAASCMDFKTYDAFINAVNDGRAYGIATRAKTDRGIARAVLNHMDIDDCDCELFEVADGERSLKSICGDGYSVYYGRTWTMFVMWVL